MRTASDGLTVQRVRAVFDSCLFKTGEDWTVHITAEGITRSVSFHPERIEDHRSDIVSLLSGLPDEFKMSGDGGASFDTAGTDKYGNQWTTDHKTIEDLILLGLATGHVFLISTEVKWLTKPGLVPTVAIEL